MGKIGSLAASDATKGGGLFGSNPQVGVIKRARYTTAFNFNGKQAALCVQLVVVDEANEEHEQYLKVFNDGPSGSVNPSGKFTVSADGRSVAIQGEDMTPNEQSAWCLFAASMANIDPEWNKRLQPGDPSVLDGVKAVFQRVKREFEIGGKKSSTEGLIITKVMAGGAGAVAGGNGASSSSEDVKQAAMTQLHELLKEKGEMALKDRILPLTQRTMKDPKISKLGRDIVALTQNADFLAEGAGLGLWSWDEKAGRIGPAA